VVFALLVGSCVYGLARVDSGWVVARSVHCEFSGLKFLRLLEILRIDMAWSLVGRATIAPAR
jgi:hypothetical protein